MAKSTAVANLTRALFTPRPLFLLLTVSLGLGALYVLTMLPVAVIAGTASFWQFPHGSIGGSENDMADYMVAYWYLANSPWQLPLLFVHNLNVPIGTNIFWLDAVPWVCLLGKFVSGIWGSVVNPFGVYVFACFALPGVAMTALLAGTGQRSLIAAVAGTSMAEATPYLLFRWGHIPLLAQFWIIGGLALYLLSASHPRSWRVATAWILLLCLLVLTNIYIFVMLAAIWAAAAMQRRLNNELSNLRLLAEAAIAIMAVASVMLVSGILSSNLQYVESTGFGGYSLNLVGPIVPQMSGLIPPLSHYRVGMNEQYEGFSYLGAGSLLLLAISLHGWVDWIRRCAMRHIALIVVFGCFLVFALSNRIYIGSHLILQIPLSGAALHLLSTFRSSGRFFWPIGYALVAGSILLILRRFRPMASLVVLTLASVLQLADVEPLRRSVAATVRSPAPTVFDQAQLAELIGRSQSVMIFPSFDCVQSAAHRDITRSQANLLEEVNVEFQLQAARANQPINSVYNTRLSTDCAAEDNAKESKLRVGTLYVYLTPYTPTQDQLDGHAMDDVCSFLAWLHYCLIPNTPQRPWQP